MNEKAKIGAMGLLPSVRTATDLLFAYNPPPEEDVPVPPFGYSRGYLPGVLNQQATPTCVGHAGATEAMALGWKMTRNRMVCDPFEVYAKAQEMDEIAGPHEGSTIKGLSKAAYKTGFNLTDSDGTKYIFKIGQYEMIQLPLDQGALTRTGSFSFSADSIIPSRLRVIWQALHHYDLIVVGLVIHAGWNERVGGVVPWKPDYQWETMGGHALVLFETAIIAEQVHHGLRGSWGKNPDDPDGNHFISQADLYYNLMEAYGWCSPKIEKA